MQQQERISICQVLDDQNQGSGASLTGVPQQLYVLSLTVAACKPRAFATAAVQAQDSLLPIELSLSFRHESAFRFSPLPAAAEPPFAPAGTTQGVSSSFFFPLPYFSTACFRRLMRSAWMFESLVLRRGGKERGRSQSSVRNVQV